jgi:hypothetical protein
MAIWGNRDKAKRKQQEAGKIDQGERASVTAGRNMDGFVTLVADIVKGNGLAHADIHLSRRVCATRLFSADQAVGFGRDQWRPADRRH